MNTDRQREPTRSRTDRPPVGDRKGENGMEKYEPLKKEAIEFETEEVIVTSEPGDTPWAPIG